MSHSASSNEIEQGIGNELFKSAAEMLIHALISSRLDFSNSLFYNLPQKDVTKLQRLQNSAARLLTFTKKFDPVSPILHSLHWLPVEKRIIFYILLLVHHSVYSLSPECLSSSINLLVVFARQQPYYY